MADIKSVISLLCRQLQLLCDLPIRADHLRAAKFNDTSGDCVPTLWRLLYCLCSHGNRCGAASQDNPVTYVKLHLLSLGYDSLDMFLLPADMSAGSRELLMAVAWLLAVHHVLHHMVQDRLRDSSLSAEFGEQLHQQVQADSTCCTTVGGKMVPVDADHLLWLAGKVRHNVNTIAEADEERVRLVTQVHRASLDTCGLPHLSVSDTGFVRRPEVLSAQLGALAKDTALINLHRQWQKKKHIFWEWMGTVITKKEEEGTKHTMVSSTDKKELVLFLHTLRNKTAQYLAGGATTHGEHHPQLVQHGGMPRYLLQQTLKETEVDGWLAYAKQQLCRLEDQLVSRQEDMNGQLRAFELEMQHAGILSSRAAASAGATQLE